MGNLLGGDNSILTEPIRRIHLAQNNLETQRQNKRYKDNSVKTGKYEWWNFLVLNLFDQFKKAPNVYFLIISFLQTI